MVSETENKRILKKIPVLLVMGMALFIALPINAQNITDDTIRRFIEEFKKDDRGPYKDLRWFCPDGSVIPPKERCPQKGGVQRARYKDVVKIIQDNRHIFLGQILATTEFIDFWDAGNNQSRMKQYQLERYLRDIDNGWIIRRAQYYRGAIQAEDEENWGVRFYHWLLSNDKAIREQFFLIRQSLRDIPHREDDNLAQKMRRQAQEIAEVYEPFMDLRVKIHNQPQLMDIKEVTRFKKIHSEKLSQEIRNLLDDLINTMQAFFKPLDIESLKKQVDGLSVRPAIKVRLTSHLDELEKSSKPQERITVASKALMEIRESILEVENPAARLTLLDISINLEDMTFREALNWEAKTLKELIRKIHDLSLAAAGSGFIELWEWQQIAAHLKPLARDNIDVGTLYNYLQLARSQVEWGTGMINSTYGEVMEKFERFEPLAHGFNDDKIRSSVLLPLGKSVGLLGDFIATQSGLKNQVMDIPNQGHIRGLNPGFAYGEMVVATGSPEDLEISPNKIYVFERPPADLKPVAGILTVTEGNLVSHVQLLARNLGIPNAVISRSNFEDLKKYSAKRVFYAVSNKGTVVMKPETEMTRQENSLFDIRKRSDERIRVPVDKINLEQTSVLNLRDVKASDSGIICGPKAANLGQLKRIFPDKVVEGLVLPFGIFHRHMLQSMTKEGISYWRYLNQSFERAEEMRKKEVSTEEIDSYLIKHLQILGEAIKSMDLLPGFKKELETTFKKVLDSEMGTVPVFIRSDTNMEDLRDFTGAGLNLTVFNVLDREKIYQGIRDVWASAYTERSFRWRQKMLLNPENVFPSILIIPSVDVDYSGVIITKGLGTGDPEELTIAFSRGAGGAVEGQMAESYLIRPTGKVQKIAPSREPYYTVLPVTGGVEKRAATYNSPILNEKNIAEIRALADSVKKVIPNTPGIASEGPYDIELGFKNDRLWLFQIRPFVESKNAIGSTYLESITPNINMSRKIKLSTRL